MTGFFLVFIAFTEEAQRQQEEKFNEKEREKNTTTLEAELINLSIESTLHRCKERVLQEKCESS